MRETISILGTTLKPTAKNDILSAIARATRENPITIATPNPEFILLARQNNAFKQALEGMSFHAIDGIGLFIALKILQRIKKTAFVLQKYPGVELMEDVFQLNSEGQKRIALIGGDAGAAAKKAAQLTLQYPNISIVFAERGGLVSDSAEIAQETQVALIASKPDIIFVGFGAPKQELWIETMKNLRIPVLVGVGGSFNFTTTKKRAPKLVRKAHLEWLWRTATEKGHFKRAWRATIVFTTRFLISIVTAKA